MIGSSIKTQVVDAFHQQAVSVVWEPGIKAADIIAQIFRAFGTPPPGTTYKLGQLFQVLAPQVTLYDPKWGILSPDVPLNGVPKERPLHFHPPTTGPSVLSFADVPLGDSQTLADLAMAVVVQRNDTYLPVLLPRHLTAGLLYPLIALQTGGGEIPALYNAGTERWLETDVRGELPTIELRHGDLLEIRERSIASQIKIEDEVVVIKDDDILSQVRITDDGLPSRTYSTSAQYQLDKTRIELVVGDITQQDTDMIVNAANGGLQGGGGVDGAIHAVAGSQLALATRPFAPLETGRAVLTPGFRLRARWVVHTVGPVYRGGKSNEATLLASAYHESLKIALNSNINSIAVPSISTGIYGYPIAEAAPIALKTIMETLQSVHGDSALQVVRFVLFSDSDFYAYQNALRRLTST